GSFAIAERLAIEIWHYEVEHPVRGLAQPKERADVRMIQLLGDSAFTAALFAQRRVAGQPGQENLETDDLPRRVVPSAVAEGHASSPDPTSDVIAAVEHLAG